MIDYNVGYMKKTILLLLILGLSISLSAQNNDSVGVLTIRAFYEKYAFLTDEQSKAFQKSKSKDAFLAYEKQVGELARTYCTESFFHKWQTSEMADLLTDENPIDGLAAKTLTVKCAGDHYVVSYSAHTDYYDFLSPIANVTFDVYLDNAEKLQRWWETTLATQMNTLFLRKLDQINWLRYLLLTCQKERKRHGLFLAMNCQKMVCRK